MPLDITMFESSQILIPFLFVLAVVYGALQVANVFKNRAVNFIISLAVAFFAVSNTFFVNLLWSQFGNITVFFIAMFFIIFVLEAFGLRKGEKKGRAAEGLIISGGILFGLLAIGSLYLDLIPSLPIIGGGENLLLFFAIVFILAIFWAAFKIGTMGEIKPEHKEG